MNHRMSSFLGDLYDGISKDNLTDTIPITQYQIRNLEGVAGPASMSCFHFQVLSRISINGPWPLLVVIGKAFIQPYPTH